MRSIPSAAQVHSSKEGNHQGAPRPAGRAPEGRSPSPEKPRTSQLGNEMAHIRGRTLPVLSGSCFLNKKADPAQTPRSSTDGRLENTELLPDYRLCPSPISPATRRLCRCSSEASWESEHQGLSPHQLHRGAESVPLSGVDG